MILKAELRQLLRECRKELKQVVKDMGGCDHSVGVCCCDLIYLIERVDRATKER